MDDATVKHNTVRDSDEGIEMLSSPRPGDPQYIGKAKPQYILLRDNTLEDVTRPYYGDALDKALILPPLKAS